MGTYGVRPYPEITCTEIHSFHESFGSALQRYVLTPWVAHQTDHRSYRPSAAMTPSMIMAKISHTHFSCDVDLAGLSATGSV